MNEELENIESILYEALRQSVGCVSRTASLHAEWLHGAWYAPYMWRGAVFCRFPEFSFYIFRVDFALHCRGDACVARTAR
jgi:hypothetical protein